MVLPSVLDISWQKLHSADSFTVSVMLFRQPSFFLQYWHLKRPKHQPGANLVCPSGRKEMVVLVCLPVSVCQTRHRIMCNCFYFDQHSGRHGDTCVYPRTCSSKKKCTHLTAALAPLPHSPALLIRKFACWGMALQFTPKGCAFVWCKDVAVSTFTVIQTCTSRYYR